MSHNSKEASVLHMREETVVMSQRGMQTKNEILRAAKNLFIQKGYVAVTMSDLCEATALSRGGLYRHYASTKDIFLELLRNDKDDWEEEMVKAIAEEFPASKMLSRYLEHVHKGILGGEGRLSLAIYEYWRTERDDDGFLKKRYENAVDMMERLLRYGQSSGVFGKFDAHTEAERLVIFIDGLKMAAIVALTPETVKRQLDALISQVLSMEERE